ncbi:hypothetical protein ACFX13_027324 [Malus domestica]
MQSTRTSLRNGASNSLPPPPKNAIYKLTLGEFMRRGLPVVELIVDESIIQGFNPAFVIDSAANIKDLPQGVVP